MSHPRAVAIVAVRHEGRLLVFEARDEFKGETFHRPLGGGIDVGERGTEAAVRELEEETGMRISPPRYVGTLENIFTLEGEPGHEIVLVYEASPEDAARLARDAPATGRAEDGSTFPLAWIPLDGDKILYPDGLRDLLRQP